MHNNDSEDNRKEKGGEYLTLVDSSTTGGIGDEDSSLKRTKSGGYYTDIIDPWGMPVLPYLHDWRMSTTAPSEQHIDHPNTPNNTPTKLLIQENLFVQESLNINNAIRKRRRRVNKEKSFVLEAEFRKNPRPTTEKKRQLAILLDLDLARVHGW